MRSSEPKNPSFNSVQEFLNSLDPFLAIGILFSIALSLFLVIIGIDTVDSLLVGLMTATISLIVDLIARLKDSEKKLARTIRLVDLLIQDSQLSDRIYMLVTGYLAAKRGWFNLFASRADEALAECANTLQALADGYMIAEPGGDFAFGKKGIEQAKSTVKSISCTPPESWQSSHWKAVLKANAEAVQRGVSITRVFIQDEDTHARSEEVLAQQREAGIHVFLVSPSELPSKYQS